MIDVIGTKSSIHAWTRQAFIDVLFTKDSLISRYTTTVKAIGNTIHDILARSTIFAKVPVGTTTV